MSAQEDEAAQSQFIEMMISRHPRLSTVDAERVLLDCYERRGRAVALTGERDENFHVICDEGSQFALKISHPAEPFELADLAVAAMRHVTASAPELGSPKVITNRANQAISKVIVGSAERWARLVSWVDGRVLNSTPPSARQRAACGTYAARLGRAMQDFDHDHADRALIWDIAQFPRFASQVMEAAPLSIAGGLQEFLGWYDSEVQPRLRGLRRQVVHGDMNRRNIVMSAIHDDVINGVIDFGDVVKTHAVCDLAVAATANIGGIGTFDTDVEDVRSAYQSEGRLTREELNVLKPLIAMRVVMGILIPAWYRQQNPVSQHYSARTIPVEESFAIARGLISTSL